MTPHRVSKPLLLLAALFVCTLATNANAQPLPKKTARVPEPKPVSSAPRRETHPVPRPTAPAVAKTPVTVESKSFLELGDTFREQKKWRAAAAAYKEAVNVWSGNADALLKLGYLYVEKNKLDDAQQTYNKLRPVNASAAADLLAEINRLKNELAH